MGFFDKIKEGLAKTKKAMANTLDAIFIGGEIDDDFYDELTDCLILADLGVNTATKAVERLREVAREKRMQTTEEAREYLKMILAEMLYIDDTELQLRTKPSVVLVIGVNGAGKTTSIGKIANSLKRSGKKVVVAAADTFRAAAIDQLGVWCERAGVDMIRQSEGSDPAAVVYDAVNYAKNKQADVLLVDTAGRLHNKKNLMNELAKINRVIERELPGASRENLLVLDATTGQNAVLQAKEFRQAAELSGLILTKLDGTAKGGIVLSIKKELDVPVKFIGVGEKAEDLMPFEGMPFVEALLEEAK